MLKHYCLALQPKIYVLFLAQTKQVGPIPNDKKYTFQFLIQIENFSKLSLKTKVGENSSRNHQMLFLPPTIPASLMSVVQAWSIIPSRRRSSSTTGTSSSLVELMWPSHDNTSQRSWTQQQLPCHIWILRSISFIIL